MDRKQRIMMAAYGGIAVYGFAASLARLDTLGGTITFMGACLCAGAVVGTIIRDRMATWSDKRDRRLI